MKEPVDSLNAPLTARVTPYRWGLAGVGVVCFALGGVGAVTPLLPTTIFLLIGSFCLIRSCPRLEDWFFRRRLFAKYAGFIRSKGPMPAAVRRTALGMMWLSLSVSVAVLALTGRLTPVMGAVAAGLGAFGTVGILRFRRPPGVGAGPTRTIH
ncbi:MAG: YbaN family protein [Phycisphaerales bacterium]